jgi:hypothetical protein
MPRLRLRSWQSGEQRPMVNNSRSSSYSHSLSSCYGNCTNPMIQSSRLSTSLMGSVSASPVNDLARLDSTNIHHVHHLPCHNTDWPIADPLPEKGHHPSTTCLDPRITWSLRIQLSSILPKPQQKRVGSQVWNHSLFRTPFPNNADKSGQHCLAHRTPPQAHGYNLLVPIFPQILLLVD